MNLFQRKDCMLPIYTLAAISKFGQQALDWDPLILRDAFQQAFNCKLTQRAFDKLMAGTTMIGTNLFSSSIQTFLACTAACNNKRIDSDKLTYVSLKDCCWSVFTYKDMLGWEQEQDTQEFDPDIIMYINGLMQVDGISSLPEYMQFANLPEAKITTIQEALVSDTDAFQAYTNRQLNQVQDINAYVKQMQQNLISQLTELDPVIHQK